MLLGRPPLGFCELRLRVRLGGVEDLPALLVDCGLALLKLPPARGQLLRESCELPRSGLPGILLDCPRGSDWSAAMWRRKASKASSIVFAS